ncbi:hypothetical protein ASO20_00915 [Mycoplasma sp. (ex Biomphalaria glabrata)]|uniref:SufD family Fe-S cluster assembly protein n=1 Tax=Mycoplasma sp. (ex Biomphalaria glabrata) TaxID=1749074 RepID=UPI00073A712E|nr:SufD family Fe-S cluster assembly protein [Mycoplasma sp. (ex Biomphalaria glabrata)]ALV23230.1 hypothetical protein ASO20_00915 [Mycoplasma sp. (ex Biomphalaria glabrata)]
MQNLLKIKLTNEINIDKSGIYQIDFNETIPNLTINVAGSDVSIWLIGNLPKIKWNIFPNVIKLERIFDISNNNFIIDNKFIQQTYIHDQVILASDSNQKVKCNISLLNQINYNLDFLGISKKNNIKDVEAIINHKCTNSKSFVKSFFLAQENSVNNVVINNKLAPKMSNCEVDQNILFLQTSPKTKCSGIPIIEATDNKVKASHSCFIGNINQDHVFYLRSKGIEKLKAEKILIFSMFNNIFTLNINKYIIKKYEEYFK